MSWDAVDWDDKLVKVENHKLGKKTRSARYRYVAMSQNLIAWLQPYRHWEGPIWPATCWESMHKEARTKAGVYDSWGHDVLRHTFASYLFALKQDAAYTASQMGHESATMIFRHYRRLTKPAEAVEFWNIYPTEALPEPSSVDLV
jgi:integrase